MKSSRLLVSMWMVAAVGCRFDEPSFEGTNFRCEPPEERCPDGYRCEAGMCVGEEADAAADEDAEPPGPDAIDGPVDLTPTFGDRPDADYQNVTDDTTLDNVEPDRVRGADAALDIDAAPLKNGLIKFDLSALPPTAVVVAAEMEVEIFDPVETGNVEGYLVLESWSELTGTWNVRITGLPWLGAGATGASRGVRIASFAPRTIGTATVALSPAAVQAWIADPTANFGVVWISTSPDGRGGQWYSREHPTPLERPILRLTLAP